MDLSVNDFRGWALLGSGNGRKLERFGDDRLVRVAEANSSSSAQELVDEVLAHLRRFAGTEPQFDDITVVAVRRAG